MWTPCVLLLGIVVGFPLVPNCDCDQAKDGLRSVIVLSRHGDRSPNEISFPKDAYHDQSLWPMGYRQLTNKGKLRQYNLGKWLRKRYTFLPEEYSPKDIYVLASDFDRTLMSATSNLAGLYPPKGKQVWNPELLWQPVPVHTRATKNDPVLEPFDNCPKYNSLYDRVDEDPFLQQLRSNYSQLYKTISDYTGWNINKFYYFAQLQSIFYSYVEENVNYLPSWYEEYYKDIEYLAAVHYTKFTYTDELSKLCHGVFFNKALTHFDAIQNGKQTTKINMFSAHQDNIASILYWAGVFDYKVPKYASSLIWELYQNEDGYYVNFLYKTNDTHVEKLTFKGCQTDCSYGRFKEILTPFAVSETERKKLCQL